MFKKGDVINAIPPKEYGEWSCLMFTEDAKPVHGNPLKYMGKARPVCQAYQDEPELGRNLFCHSCRHQCPQREYMVKYVGRFEPQEAQPQTAAKMVEKTTKHSGHPAAVFLLSYEPRQKIPRVCNKFPPFPVLIIYLNGKI